MAWSVIYSKSNKLIAGGFKTLSEAAKFADEYSTVNDRSLTVRCDYKEEERKEK